LFTGDEMPNYSAISNGATSQTWGFTIATSPSNGNFDPGAVVWGDLNNDGNVDAVVSGSVGGSFKTQIYLNNGNGTFNHILPDIGVGGYDVVLGDLNNDGFLDMVVSGDTGFAMRRYLGNGDGTFDSGFV